MPARSTVEKVKRLAGLGEHGAHGPARAVAGPRALPESGEGRCDRGLLGAVEPNVDIAPAGRSGQVVRLRFPDRPGPRLVDDVHAAEISHLVIDNQYLAMVAAVEHVHERETA